jgi:hypothetical protein
MNRIPSLQVPTSGSLWKMARANFQLKVLAFVLTLVIYAFGHGWSQVVQRTMSLDLAVVTPTAASGRMLVNQLPSALRVTVRGRESRLRDLRSDEFGSIQLDLTQHRGRTLDLRNLPLQLPPGISTLDIVDVQPRFLDLDWDAVVTRELPVKFVHSGKLAEGLTMTAAEVTPKVVTVRGPSRMVELLQSVSTQPLDMSEQGVGIRRQALALRVPERLVELMNTVVTASVTVEEVLATRIFEDVRVDVIGFPKRNTRPGSVRITLHASAEALEKVRREDLVARVEIPRVEAQPGGAPPEIAQPDTAQSGSMVLPVQVVLPGVRAEVFPPSVLLKW